MMQSVPQNPRFGRKAAKKGFVQSQSRMGPSQFRANPEVSRRYRFVSSSGTATNVTAQTLLGACGSTATSSTTGALMFQSVKLKQVEIWSPPASQGSAVTCSILWPSSNQSQPREISDTSVSVTQPAHVLSSPPPLSIAGFWASRLSTSALCTLVAPAGSIIDVWVSLVLGDGSGVATVNAVLVGAVTGAQYYSSLDSLTSAGSVYAPVSLTTL